VKAQSETEGEHEWVHEARPSTAVTVSIDPLEGEAARGGTREVEMDEDIIERRGPDEGQPISSGRIEVPAHRPSYGVAQLPKLCGVERAGNDEGRYCRNQAVKERLEGEQPA
jgi:hypothetical protein